MEPSANPTASSLVEREGDAHQRAQAARLRGDRDDRRARFGRRGLVEDAAAELDDGDDAAIELEPERRQRDRLHVAHDLLGVLALVRDDVNLGDPSVGLGDEPNDRNVGKPTDLPFDFRQVQFVHALVLSARPAAVTIERGGADLSDHRLSRRAGPVKFRRS